MNKNYILLVICNCISVSLFSQQEQMEDSIRGNLEEVIVRGYEQNRRLIDVPAAENYINRSQLNRFNNTNILYALNTTAGVKMEERSPGSYRLNIR
jgi:iron complex outermembrane receptor protein